MVVVNYSQISPNLQMYFSASEKVKLYKAQNVSNLVFWLMIVFCLTCFMLFACIFCNNLLKVFITIMKIKNMPKFSFKQFFMSCISILLIIFTIYKINLIDFIYSYLILLQISNEYSSLSQGATSFKFPKQNEQQQELINNFLVNINSFLQDFLNGEILLLFDIYIMSSLFTIIFFIETFNFYIDNVLEEGFFSQNYTNYNNFQNVVINLSLFTPGPNNEPILVTELLLDRQNQGSFILSFLSHFESFKRKLKKTILEIKRKIKKFIYCFLHSLFYSVSFLFCFNCMIILLLCNIQNVFLEQENNNSSEDTEEKQAQNLKN